MTLDDRRRRLVELRIRAVRGLLEDRGMGAALLSSRRNFAWITGGGENHVVLGSESGVAGFVVTPTDVTVLAAVNEAPRIAEEELAGLNIEVRALPWHEPDPIRSAARELFGPRVAEDAALEAQILPIRSVLGDLDIERMHWLGDEVTAASAAALAAVQPGTTEHQAAAGAVRHLAAKGIRAPVVLAAADDRIIRYRHPIPTGRGVEDRLMLVLVAERWGLHVAVTRFAELGTASDQIAERMRAVDAVHDAMVGATRPGRTLGDVLAAAQDAYADVGHPHEWRLHHQGGIIGYQGREQVAVPGHGTVITDGMAFAWNPSIAGAKAEETILLRDGTLQPITGVGSS